MRVPATSRTYIYIPVVGPDSAGDLTQYTVEAALIDDDGSEPLSGDWHAATWIGGEAALLVGPGGGAATLYQAGDYFAFARGTAGDEKPVIPSGRVRIGM